MKNKIKQLRDELNISQNELSKITGISVEDITSIENDQVEPSLVDAHKLNNLALKKARIPRFFMFICSIVY